MGQGELYPGKPLVFIPLATLARATTSHDQPSSCTAATASLAVQVPAKVVWPRSSLGHAIAFFCGWEEAQITFVYTMFSFQ